MLNFDLPISPSTSFAAPKDEPTNLLPSFRYKVAGLLSFELSIQFNITTNQFQLKIIVFSQYELLSEIGNLVL